jgi:outer membrane lipopolysaccharide assembly protein LptE/RlpB
VTIRIGVVVPRLMFVSVLALLVGGCGYRVAGNSTILPAHVKTIGIVALENRTNQYRIEQRLTAALVREFLAKTSYRVVPDAMQADAVLRGRINSLESSAVLFDASTGRATTMLVTLRCEAVLEERESQKVLYRNDNFLFRDEYEISTDLKSFFEERDPALDRMARTFAERLVAAIMEGF